MRVYNDINATVPTYYFLEDNVSYALDMRALTRNAYCEEDEDEFADIGKISQSVKHRLYIYYIVFFCKKNNIKIPEFNNVELHPMKIHRVYKNNLLNNFIQYKIPIDFIQIFYVTLIIKPTFDYILIDFD